MTEVKYMYKVVIPETTIYVFAKTTHEAREKAKTLLKKRFEELTKPENWQASPIVVFDVER